MIYKYVKNLYLFMLIFM